MTYKILVAFPHNPIWVGSSKSIIEHPAFKRKILLFAEEFNKILVFRGSLKCKSISVRNITLPNRNNNNSRILDVQIPFNNIVLYSVQVVRLVLILLAYFLPNKNIKVSFLFLDHVHIFTIIIKIIIKLLHIPVISFYVNTPFTFKERITFTLFKPCDTISIVNHPMLALNLRLRRWVLIPNMPEKEFFHNCVNIKERDKKTLLVVSRLSYEKNVETSILIAKKLVKIVPNIKILIIGDGPLRGKLESLIHVLNLQKNVFLLGYRPLGEVLFLMRKSGFLLHTSINEYFPNVIIEAMACNLPVIVFRTPAYQWILGSSIDFPLKTRTIDDIVNVIAMLIIDDKLYYKKVLLQSYRMKQLIHIYYESISLLRNFLSMLLGDAS